MRNFLLAVIVSTLAVTGPLFAEPPGGASAVSSPLFAEQSCGEPVMSSPLFAGQPSGELAVPLTLPPAQPTVCLQSKVGAAGCVLTSTCEYRSGGCRNEPGGWCTTWKYKWCMNDCCQWVKTSDTCCYTTQPNCHC